MADSYRLDRRNAGLIKVNILPPDLRAAGPSVVDASLFMVLAVGALLLISVFLIRNRSIAESQSLVPQLQSAQTGLGFLTSPQGLQLQNTLKEARSRADGLAADSDTIASRRVRWSMILRAIQSHPQVTVEEAVQTPKNLAMNIKGQAGSDAALMEYSNGLRGSGLFDDVRITSINGISPVIPIPTAGPSGPPPGAPTPVLGILPLAPTSGPPLGQPGFGPTTQPNTPPLGPSIIATPAGPGFPATGVATVLAGSTITGAVPATTTQVVGSAANPYEYAVGGKQSTFVPEPGGPVDKFPGSISGKLLDTNGNLIAGATFRLESYGSPIWTADSPSAGRARSNGTFAFTTLRRATYRVYVLAENSQAAIDLYVGADGIAGFYNWDVTFQKTTPGLPPYYSYTPTPTGVPGSPTSTNTPTATPTFWEPAPPPGSAQGTPSNNTMDRAYDLTNRYGSWLDCVCKPPSSPYGTDNQDWFKIRDIPAGARLTVSLDQATNLRLYIYTPGRFIATQDTSSSSNKNLSYDIPYNQAGTYYIQVEPIPGYSSNATYSLSPLITQPTPGATQTPTPTLTPTPTQAASFEVEPNDTCADAAARNKFAAENNPMRGAIGWVGDRDFFAISVANGQTIDAQVTQPISTNIYIYDDTCRAVAMGAGSPLRDLQTATYTVPSGKAGWWWVMVEAATGGFSPNPYVLWVHGSKPLTPTPTSTSATSVATATTMAIPTSPPATLSVRPGIQAVSPTAHATSMPSRGGVSWLGGAGNPFPTCVPEVAGPISAIDFMADSSSSDYRQRSAFNLVVTTTPLPASTVGTTPAISVSGVSPSPVPKIPISLPVATPTPDVRPALLPGSPNVLPGLPAADFPVGPPTKAPVAVTTALALPPGFAAPPSGLPAVISPAGAGSVGPPGRPGMPGVATSPTAGQMGGPSAVRSGRAVSFEMLLIVRPAAKP